VGLGMQPAIGEPEQAITLAPVDMRGAIRPDVFQRPPAVRTVERQLAGLTRRQRGSLIVGHGSKYCRCLGAARGGELHTKCEGGETGSLV
jgi:hypothetical protein